MDRYALFFIRMVMITLGFAAGAVAAGVSLALLTKFITPQEAGHLADLGFDFDLVVGAVALASLAGYVAFVPAMEVIFYAEVAKRRDWLFYALAGGIIAAIAPLIVTFMIGPGPPHAGQLHPDEPRRRHDRRPRLLGRRRPQRRQLAAQRPRGSADPPAQSVGRNAHRPSVSRILTAKIENTPAKT